ncbi:response regulator [Asaia astilbis]|uniref:response regulator n=1 Tax=Asaia astilbis TaxID=610244 RepID=UPI001E2F73B0|nr:response regulator [Asaia astilbis]
MRRTEMSVPYGRSRILLVDDEAEILVALTDLLEDEFDILSCTDPLEALAYLKKSPDIAVIVSDQRMPNMTGDVLLSKAREFSDARGILLTGYADLAAVVAALNQGRIQFYAHKPWESDAAGHGARGVCSSSARARADDRARSVAWCHGIGADGWCLHHSGRHGIAAQFRCGSCSRCKRGSHGGDAVQ